MAQVVVAQRMWQRRDTAENWTTKNPILAAGEIGVELPPSGQTAARFKVGTGTHPWNDLPYAGGGAATTDDLEEGTTNLYFTIARVFAALQDQLVAGTNVTFDIDTQAKTITINAASGGGAAAPELIAASENLSAGMFVNIWNDAGQAKVRAADSTGKPAHGFVLAAYSAGQTAEVHMRGKNSALSGMTPGAMQYLAASLGGRVESPSGPVVQELGVAISATEMFFNPDSGIEIV